MNEQQRYTPEDMERAKQSPIYHVARLMAPLMMITEARTLAGDSVPPTWVYPISPENDEPEAAAMYSDSWDSAGGRVVVLQLVHAMLKAAKAKRFAFASETWVVRQPTDAAFIEPRIHPQRTEAIMVMGCERFDDGVRGIMVTRTIKRDEAGKVIDLGERENMPTLGGDITRLLQYEEPFFVSGIGHDASKRVSGSES